MIRGRCMTTERRLLLRPSRVRGPGLAGPRPYRTVAEGDLVVTHSLLKTSPEGRGTAVADFFRLEEGKVVEHWDVLQPIPESAANERPMF